MPTLADLLADNAFDQDEWSYEGEEEEKDTVAVDKIDSTKVCFIKYCIVYSVGRGKTFKHYKIWQLSMNLVIQNHQCIKI